MCESTDYSFGELVPYETKKQSKGKQKGQTTTAATTKMLIHISKGLKFKMILNIYKYNLHIFFM